MRGFIILGVVGALACPASAQQYYDLGAKSSVESINGAGQVAVNYADAVNSVAFLWTPQTDKVDIGNLGGPLAWATVRFVGEDGRVSGASDVNDSPYNEHCGFIGAPGNLKETPSFAGTTSCYGYETVITSFSSAGATFGD